MGIPSQPVTLTPEQIKELGERLSRMRHDINNHLSLIVAALELIRYKPEIREKMIGTISEQPTKIQNEIAGFSRDLEGALSITRDGPGARHS